MKHLFAFFFLLLFVCRLAAQQTSRFTQTADEFGLDNPAGLSFEEMRYRGTTIGGYFRSQWWQTGLGFPRAQAVSWLNTRSLKSHYGANFLADKIGETRNLGLQGRYAHTLAKGLKVGVSLAGFWRRVAVENLSTYDANDPLATEAGEAQQRLAVGAGAFYHLNDSEHTWKWFAGAAFRRAFSLTKLPGGGEQPVETDLFAQGGLGRGTWLACSRIRASLNQPSALDAYVRKYFAHENYFVGANFTTDKEHQTAGIQAGLERRIRTDEKGNNQYLAVSFGFSKPLSSYVEGNSLIFDLRATWIFEKE